MAEIVSWSALGWVVLGASLGGLFIGIGGRLSWRTEVRFFAVSLFLAGAIYFGFGLAQGPPWIALEGAGLVLFTGLAFAGLQRPSALALGWYLHVGWDVGLHLLMEQPVIGIWLPLLCLPFDLMVASYLARKSTRRLDRVESSS